MRKHVVGLFVLALLFLGVPAFAQNLLVGTWEFVSSTVDGKVQPPPAPRPNGIQAGVGRIIFTADGFYNMLNIPRGRPQTTTPQDQWTKEDWQNRYHGVSGQFGAYSVSGDKLTLKVVSAMSPATEGSEVVFTFRKDVEDLILINTGNNGAKTERRYRRMK